MKTPKFPLLPLLPLLSLFLLVGFFFYRGLASSPTPPTPPTSPTSLKLYSLASDQATLLPPKTTFKAAEPVTFVLAFEKKPTSFWPFVKTAFAQEASVSARLLYNQAESKDVAVEIKPLDQDKFSFSLSPKTPGQLQPGKYQLKVNRQAAGQTQTLTQDFSWGVLAINTFKSIYTPGEVAKLGIGVLNDLGRTICNANLNLEVTDPAGNKATLSTANNTIKPSGKCQSTSVTNIPDYLAEYPVNKAGTYRLHLTGNNGNGERNLDDNFEVQESIPFDIERSDFPMRIYPPAEYQANIIVKANQDFAGSIEEFVPSSFEISKIASSQTPRNDVIASVAKQSQNSKLITWNVDWKKGQKYTLSYSIKFPPVSPEFYLVGPLTLTSPTSPIFTESRPWQIASDAITTQWMESGTDATQGFEFWTATGGTGTAVSSDTTVSKTGPRSIKADSGVGNGTSFAEQRTGFSDAGTRVSAYVYFDDLPSSNAQVLKITDSGNLNVVSVRLNTAGTLSLLNSSTVLQTGSTVLSADTRYRISVAYVITSTTVFNIKVFINGNLELSQVNSTTLTQTGSDRMRLGWTSSPGANLVMHFDDVYIDNGTDSADPGDIRVTAKLPAAYYNPGPDNPRFDTTGGTGAVNERPLSETNYMQDATGSTPGDYETYTLQTASTGDVDLSNAKLVTLVARTSWIWAMRGTGTVSTNASLIDNGAETSIMLTTTSALYTVTTDSSAYPSNAAGIGMRAIDGTADTFFYEGGALIAYKPVANMRFDGLQMEGIQIR